MEYRVVRGVDLVSSIHVPTHKEGRNALGDELHLMRRGVRTKDLEAVTFS